MATEKVGIYRKWHGPIPLDDSDRPLPKSEWPRKRLFRWAVRWFGTDGNRYSRSFKDRKEAEWFAETKQSEVRVAADNPPPSIRLGDFVEEHEKVMQGQVARRTLVSQLGALRLFMKHVGRNVHLWDIKPRHAESFVAARLAQGRKGATVNKEIRTLKAVFNLAIDPRGYLLPSQNPFARIRQRRLALKPLRFVKHLPIHVVRKLAGHSDIKTTQEYYLSVQEDDLEKARQVQSEILGVILTDPLLTHFRPLLGSRPEPRKS